MDVALDISLVSILPGRETGTSKIKQQSEIYHNINSGSTGQTSHISKFQ